MNSVVESGALVVAAGSAGQLADAHTQQEHLNDEERLHPLQSRVFKEFPGYGGFWGTVVSYTSSNTTTTNTSGHYRIVYTDGDAEDLSHTELTSLIAAAVHQKEVPTTSEAPPQVLDLQGLTTETTTQVQAPTNRRVTLSPTQTAASTNKMMPIDVDAKDDDVEHALASIIDITDSPDEDDDDDDEDFVEVVDNQDAKDRRFPKRQRVSTLVYMDGHAVKKDNNYVLKGGSYSYGVVSAAENKKAAKKQNTVKARALEKKQKLAAAKAAPGGAAAAARPLSSLQKDRLDMKQRVDKSKKDKSSDRAAFLERHCATLAPFCEQKVLNKIHENAVSASITSTKKKQQEEEQPVYMQPDLITADMRDYQLQGLNWMANMHRQGMGMILGDEMGLGKTLQTISLICHLKETCHAQGPSVVLCPLSVLYSWCNEITKWAPSLKFLRFHSSNPESLAISDVGAYDIIVTTYEMAKCPALQSLWSRQHFNLLVLDEGHKIKNHGSQISAACRKIHAGNRLILTGTPLANNLVEMWSLLNFLVPDVFTVSEPFAEAFNLTLNVVDPEKLALAHHVLKIFMLRRLKSEVEKLMPQKIETKASTVWIACCFSFSLGTCLLTRPLLLLLLSQVTCPLSNSQVFWYKALLLKDLGKLAGNSGGAGKAAVLNNLIMQLRKCCLHPFLFPGAEDPDSTTLETLVGASGKLAVLDMLLQSLFKKGHRVTLFSQFTQVLDILDDYCTLRGWKYCRFDGSTPRAKRNFVVNSFNAPDSEKFIFLMSTRSGGMGLNLQTADTCILFDSDWNPQPDIQAMARVHRIGQTKTVHVYRLVTAGTVEERMIERAQKKLYLDRMVTRDGVSELTLDESEDSDKLMSTLRFGCNAVFGQNSDKHALPTDQDIETITDRSRTEDFSDGNLKGGADATAKEFDATTEFTATTDFGGVDFKKLRDEHGKKTKPKDIGQITELWKKRQRKNRIKMVEGTGSGYGSLVPVLAMNDYDLETGEKSVFDRELKGRNKAQKKEKKTKQFDEQDFCQVCGDGGDLICCPRCPVSLHPKCIGLKNSKNFLCCTHHHCSVCDKSASAVGGFLFPCSACPNAYCEDHLPTDSRILEDGCERMETLGFNFKQGVYVHCSSQCEHIAKTEYNWTPPKKKTKAICPPVLDISSNFGGEVDDALDSPEDDVVMSGKRRRKKVDYRHSVGSAQQASPVRNRRESDQPFVYEVPSDDEDEGGSPYTEKPADIAGSVDTKKESVIFMGTSNNKKSSVQAKKSLPAASAVAHSILQTGSQEEQESHRARHEAARAHALGLTQPAQKQE
jgi:SWI/SNF-related matrix-associated actin-dependent regulator of chromatin subfamily A member 5